ncbi:MAG: cell division protein ZapA [Clostridia bacterium]|nr:cell division protein ZapA [Clostridia bacterium]
MEKTRTVVNLGGQDFKITCDDSEAYIKELAKFVNKKIEEIQYQYPALSTGNCVLLATLNMADELHKLREDYDALDSRISQLREMPRSGSAAAPVKRPFESAKQPALTK